MGRVIEKIWGTTEPLVVTPMFEMHRLHIKPCHRCSFHVHRFKHNAFYVLGGSLIIDHADSDFEPHAEPTLILPDQVFVVPPGLHHQFRTGVAPCIALEMYFTEPLSEDIIRRNVGGPV
jgi:mannose-6-phosphate isomerase-like protein (cupin superfamily)